MKKIAPSLLIFSSISIIIPSNTQAMNGGDKYMDDLDWYKFNSARASNPSLSDRERWEASKLAARNHDDYARKRGFDISVDPYQIYRTGKIGEVEKPYSALPPLSSNQQTTTVHYQHSSSPSVTYQNSGRNYNASSGGYSVYQRLNRNPYGSWTDDGTPGTPW